MIDNIFKNVLKFSIIIVIIYNILNLLYFIVLQLNEFFRIFNSGEIFVEIL